MRAISKGNYKIPVEVQAEAENLDEAMIGFRDAIREALVENGAKRTAELRELRYAWGKLVCYFLVVNFGYGAEEAKSAMDQDSLGVANALASIIQGTREAAAYVTTREGL